MAVEGTISAVNRVGERVAVNVNFTDGSSQEFLFSIPVDKTSAIQEIKNEVARRNSLDADVDKLKTYIGTVVK